MGCGASRAVQPDQAVLTAEAVAAAAAAYKLAEGRATSELTGAALSFGQLFEIIIYFCVCATRPPAQRE